MANVYVIHAASDTPFLKERVLRILPANGYDSWTAVSNITGDEPLERFIALAIERSQAVLIILSPALLSSQWAAREIELAMAARRMLIVVQISAISEKEAEGIPARLKMLPKVDFTLEEEGEAERLLVALLPSVDAGSMDATPKGAERIEWNEEIFSRALAAATARHDHAHVESLVETIADHLRDRPYAYPPQHAFNDLKMMRRERQFELMRRYAKAVIDSGTTQDRVRRMYGQALIETGHYDKALEVLQSIIDQPDSSQEEVFEARGLIGRTFKQRYVDAPDAPGAEDQLRQAIKAYETAYLEDRKNFWHGVNAASCMIRAEREGIATASSGRARVIAEQIVEDLEKISLAGPLQVFDSASLVEALLALERYPDAEAALDAYLIHPDMTAFEVSSTFRQFDQVLQLGNNPPGATILSRLRSTMERYRAGSIVVRPASRSAESVGEEVRLKPLVIRLAEPDWELTGVTDLTVQSRLGKIVTARGSEASIRELLSDSIVISVEESRPAGQIECDRSVPFIRVAAEYTAAGGPYKEKGDSALIAVIDDSIDVLHQAFLDAHGKSRILGIWDQTDESLPRPLDFSYGRFHDENAIAGYVAAPDTLPAGLAGNPGSHGTHVASIAAGRAVGNFAGGVAPEAKLLVIISGGSGPIGYSQTHIEALHFIDKFARDKELPVVVNLSQGMNAGAHDGKSALEVAFDAFSDTGRRSGRVVIKSAGNERGKNGHAKVSLMPDSEDELKWRRDPRGDVFERIELWWSSADELEFRLQEPGPRGEFSDWVTTAVPERRGVLPTGGPYQMSFTKRHIDNGDSALVIELGSPAREAARGDWRLEIRSRAVPEGSELHCWIERGGGVPTSFLNHIDEEMTLSIPGTAESVIAVGAVDARNPIRVGSFSSYGPTRNKQWKPLVCAPGVGVNAARAGTGNGAFAKDGTSMAAPHVAGAIALLLSKMAKSKKVPSGSQIASALRQKTQNYNGRWDRGQGYGVIDVTALLAAFD